MLDVIIVDDSKEDALLAQRVLLGECKIMNPITICTNGKDAIGLCTEFHKAGRPALMLLDLVMAPVSGLEVLRCWRASPYSTRSMVVMVSGLNDLKAINEGYQLGAKTFILKPITKDDMVQVLNSLGDQVAVHKEAQGYSLHWAPRGTELPTKGRSGTRVLAIST